MDNSTRDLVSQGMYLGTLLIVALVCCGTLASCDEKAGAEKTARIKIEADVKQAQYKFRTEAMTRMVSSGANPIAARCAVEGDMNKPECMLALHIGK